MTFYAKVNGAEMKICTSRNRFYNHALIRIDENGRFKCIQRTAHDTEALLHKFSQIHNNIRNILNEWTEICTEKSNIYSDIEKMHGTGYCERMAKLYFDKFWHFDKYYMIVNLYTKETKQ